MSLTALRREAVVDAVRALGPGFVSAEAVATYLRSRGQIEDLFGRNINRRSTIMASLRSAWKDGEIDRSERPSYGAPTPVYRTKPA